MIRHTSKETQTRRVVDEVLRIARSEHATVTLSGGSKAHVLIVKQVLDTSDPTFRFLMSAIEFATRHHFAQVFDTGSLSEWVLKSPLVDVTARCSKR